MIWKNWPSYYWRRLEETKMYRIKLLGEKPIAKHFQNQVNEIYARVSVLNKFTELGQPIFKLSLIEF